MKSGDFSYRKNTGKSRQKILNDVALRGRKLTQDNPAQKALRMPGPEKPSGLLQHSSNLLALPPKIQPHNRLSIHEFQPTLQR